MNQADWQLLKRTLKYSKRLWKRIVVLALVLTLIVILNLLYPLLTKFYFDHILVGRQIDLVYVIVAGYFLVYVISFLFMLLQTWLERTISLKVLFFIRFDLLKSICKFSLSLRSSYKIGELMTCMENDVGTINQMAVSRLLSLLTDVIKAVVSLILIFILFSFFGWVILCLVPFYILIIRKSSKVTQRISEQYRQNYGEYQSFLQQTFSGIAEIQNFLRFREREKKFTGYTRKLMRQEIRNNLVFNLTSFANSFLRVLAENFIMLWSAFMVYGGKMPIGTYIAISAYHGQIFVSAVNISNLNLGLQQVLVSLRRIFGILDLDQSHWHKLQKDLTTNEIIFHNVTFSYPDNPPILQEISLHIHQGEKIALVGKSGIGKTTLCQLLIGYYLPTQGQITMDNIDLARINPRSLFNKIGLVSQDIYLFNESITENITSGKKIFTRQEIEEAAKQAGIHKFIKKLPQGYDTIVDESIKNISGGEKQRIAIARIILHNPEIIIFDEATAAMDQETETTVLKALFHWGRRKTIILISHRLSTVLAAERVIYLANGRICGDGKHEELLSFPDYQKLFGQDETNVFKTYE